MILFNYFLFFSSLTSFKESGTIDLLLIYLMLIASLIPIIAISKKSNILDKLASASSFGSKLSLIIVFYSFVIGDWMIGSIGAFTLIVGDAGLIVLSFLYKEDYQWTFYFYYLIVFYLSGYSFGFGEQFQYLKKRTLCFTNFILWPYQIQ